MLDRNRHIFYKSILYYIYYNWTEKKYLSNTASINIPCTSSVIVMSKYWNGLKSIYKKKMDKLVYDKYILDNILFSIEKTGASGVIIHLDYYRFNELKATVCSMAQCSILKYYSNSTLSNKNCFPHIIINAYYKRKGYYSQAWNQFIHYTIYGSNLSQYKFSKRISMISTDLDLRFNPKYVFNKTDIELMINAPTTIENISVDMLSIASTIKNFLNYSDNTIDYASYCHFIKYISIIILQTKKYISNVTEYMDIVFKILEYINDNLTKMSDAYVRIEYGEIVISFEKDNGFIDANSRFSSDSVVYCNKFLWTFFLMILDKYQQVFNRVKQDNTFILNHDNEEYLNSINYWEGIEYAISNNTLASRLNDYSYLGQSYVLFKHKWYEIYNTDNVNPLDFNMYDVDFIKEMQHSLLYSLKEYTNISEDDYNVFKDELINCKNMLDTSTANLGANNE